MVLRLIEAHLLPWEWQRGQWHHQLVMLFWTQLLSTSASGRGELQTLSQRKGLIGDARSHSAPCRGSFK